MSMEFSFPLKLFVDGAWRDAASGRTEPVVNPASGAAFARVAWGGEPDAQAAVSAAAKAFPAWSATPAPARGDTVKRIAALLTQDRERLAPILTREQGKPLAQALGEVDYSASFFQWFGEEARRLCPRSVPHADPAKASWVEPRAAGVVGAITPWNFPLAQAAKKVSAALAAGCCVVLKPAPATPLMALALAWVAQRAGLPPGVLSVVPGDAEPIGRVLLDRAEVRVISFTGSVRVGAWLASEAGRRLKRVTLELGGNAPFCVLADADLDLAAEDLVRLKLMVSGQVCVTANRVFVHSSRMEAFRAKLVERLRGTKVGDGLAAGVQAGPLINAAAVAKVKGIVEDALAQGARVAWQADLSFLPADLKGGFFYPPTVLDGVTDAMRAAREEVFGPVFSLMAFEDEEELVRRANATEYGLAGYVYTRDLARGFALARRIEVGIAGVNDMRPLRAEVPFGGIKGSGQGREGGAEGLAEYLEARVIGARIA
ncbi:MAG TPA: NAD-dependent succinate-semialdehyde dehydrogenase [Candidatus Brocadiia bacterium]|nr:NAD-dependent succinate-semialdehyde dehydrogenase [Candidatus Brocadiia bacterium]